MADDLQLQRDRALAIARAKVRLQEQKEADEAAAARAAEPKVTFGQEAPGVANTALERGLIGIQGIPGSILESGMQLGGYLDRTFAGGTTTPEQIHERNPIKDYLPTSGDYIADYEKRQAEAGAPPPVEPQTSEGKFLAKGLQGAAGGIVGGPWGFLTGGLSGLGSEGGRQLAEDTAFEGPAEVFGGIAGAMSPTAFGRAVSPRNINEINAAHAALLRSRGIRHLTEGQVSASPRTMTKERARMSAAAEGRGMEQLEDLTAETMRQAGVPGRVASRPVLHEAFQREGRVVRDVASRNNLNFDEQAYNRLAAGVDDYNDLVPEASRAPFINRFRNEIEDLYTAPGAGPVMSGEKYQAYRSRLSRMARGTEDPQLRMVLRDLQETLDEAMDRSVRPEDAGVWQDFRGRYRNLLVLAEAVSTRSREANLGIVTPAALQMGLYNIYGKRNMVTGQGGQGDLPDVSTAASGLMSPLPFTGGAPMPNKSWWDAGFAAPLQWGFERLPQAVRMSSGVQRYLTNRMIAREPNASMLPPGSSIAQVTGALSDQGAGYPSSPIDPRIQSVMDALIPR